LKAEKDSVIGEITGAVAHEIAQSVGRYRRIRQPHVQESGTGVVRRESLIFIIISETQRGEAVLTDVLIFFPGLEKEDQRWNLNEFDP